MELNSLMAYGYVGKDCVVLSRNTYAALLAIDEKVHELKSLTGMNIDDIIDKFAQGYEFVKTIDDARKIL